MAIRLVPFRANAPPLQRACPVTTVQFPSTNTPLFVKVCLYAVKKIVKGRHIKGEFGPRRVVCLVVMQHDVEKFRPRQLVLLGIELHGIVDECLTVRVLAGRLDFSGVVIDFKPLAAVCQVVAYLERYRDGAPERDAHEAFAHPRAAVFEVLGGHFVAVLVLDGGPVTMEYLPLVHY